METNEVTTDKLVNDLKAVVRDAEELLKATAGQVGDQAKVARERLGLALESAKTTCQDLEEKALAQAQATFQATDKVVREHPYESLGVAFGVGIIIGLILNRR